MKGKAKMAELADGFVALPGGPGTLEEFFEVFTWAQLGLHQKPCGLLNINRYFDPLVELFNHMITEQFLQERYRAMALVDVERHKLLDKFDYYEAPDVKTWEGKTVALSKEIGLCLIFARYTVNTGMVDEFVVFLFFSQRLERVTRPLVPRYLEGVVLVSRLNACVKKDCEEKPLISATSAMV